MEYSSEWIHILKNIGLDILEKSENLKNLTDIIISILGGICVITGIYYLKNLKEKKYAATFGFWVQLIAKLKRIKNRLEEDNNLINHMFSQDSRSRWTNAAAPAYQSDIDELKSIAQRTLDIIDSASDQMPAYPGWTDDYTFLMDFLDDLFRYDIGNPNERFKYNGVHTIEERNQYVTKVCDTLGRLISGIENAQKAIEKALF